MANQKYEEFPYGELGLIVMSNIKDLGEEIDKLLMELNNTDQSYILDISEDRFSNGEGKVTIDQSVRGKDILILSDIGNYGETYQMFGSSHNMSPDEHYQDIKRVISAINGKATRINVMMPLLYESRQHRRKKRESLDCAMALQELQSIGVDGIYTFDVHDPNVQNAIPLMTFENIYPTAEIVNYFLEEENITNEDLKKNNMLIISPDTGAMDRAIYYSNILKQDIGLFYKRRDYSKLVNGKNPIVEHKYIGQDVKDKDILIVDDMIASGGSVIDIAKQLKNQGAKRVFCAVSFALFTEGVAVFDEVVKDGYIDAVYSTNLTYVPKEIKEREWFHSVNMSELMSDLIDHINREKSLSPLLDKTRGIKTIL